MDEILQYEADYGEEDNKKANVRSEIIETILYQRALKAAQKPIEDGHQITPWLTKAIHQKLLSFGRGAFKSPGKFKHEQNYIADKTKKLYCSFLLDCLFSQCCRKTGCAESKYYRKNP